VCVASGTEFDFFDPLTSLPPFSSIRWITHIGLRLWRSPRGKILSQHSKKEGTRVR